MGKKPKKPKKKPSEGLSSFKDLLRAQGGEVPEETGAKDRGWTVHTADGMTIGDAEEQEGAGETVGERIGRRPQAYGPMNTGPKVYREEDSEEMRILQSFRVRTVFPDDVLAEVEDLPEDPEEKDFEGRVDLRGETIFTIDGEDAKDYDDAIGIRRLPNGNLELGVHIADVGHYVRPGTALDAEALARATSVYLPDQVVPMLPEKISNHLCSLVPHRDRLAYSVLMEFDPSGKRVASRVHKSVIRSVHRNTYRVVQDLLDGVKSEETEEIAFLHDSLRLFREWTIQQQKIRDAKGSLRMQSRERKFLFDEEHEVVKIVDAPRYFSQTLIEETALAANQAVGDLFRARGLPTIYRVHPRKDPEEIEAIAKMLAEFGIRVPNKDRLSGRDVGGLIRIARNRPNADALIQRIMGLVERATYAVKDHIDTAKHWGLAREAYLHFTSPIRRYPDLFVHRWLHAIESRGAEAEEELQTNEFLEDMNEMAQHASLQANIAEMAEKAMGDLKVCQYMSPHVGETLEAKILRVSRYGLEIFLKDYNVSGFLPARSIGERPELKGPTLILRAGRRLFSFTEGYAIQVRIKGVDFLRLQVLFELP
ncbi:MAG TPA: RNB domain-containing ribonuclease [Planctomycetes bacterium]|nr:RNB domain-containing ribonuclease [Planctomycetota bacterium]